MDDGERTKHRRALEIIAANPSRFGFTEVREVAIELTIRDKRGIPVAEPDLQLVFLNGDLHLTEYKNRKTESNQKLARRQLKRAKEWYVAHKGIDPEKIYTHIIFGDDPKYATLLSMS
jgi:hypothetical protein